MKDFEDMVLSHESWVVANFTDWVSFLRDDKRFGQNVKKVFSGAFEQVQLHTYTASSARKTLGQELSERKLLLAT